MVHDEFMFILLLQWKLLSLAIIGYHIGETSFVAINSRAAHDEILYAFHVYL